MCRIFATYLVLAFRLGFTFKILPGTVFGQIKSPPDRARENHPRAGGGHGLNIFGVNLPLAKRARVLSNLPVLNQQTLNRPATFSGTGLHSGNRVNMSILPAPANSGVRFRRVDLDGKPEIEARVENVTDTNRSTTITKGNVKVHTVEHVLAALAGCGIDNAIVELDANEPPIADGSSREFGKIIQAAGILPQAEKREFYTPTEPIEMQSGETVMTLFPYDGFKLTCTSADKQGRFTEFYSTDITPAKTWEKELSHARTFCFYEEIEFLFKDGLIKGGSPWRMPSSSATTRC